MTTERGREHNHERGCLHTMTNEVTIEIQENSLLILDDETLRVKTTRDDSTVRDGDLPVFDLWKNGSHHRTVTAPEMEDMMADAANVTIASPRQ